MPAISNKAETRILESWVRSEDMILRLFVNNFTPSRDSQLKDFKEAKQYTPAKLSRQAWQLRESAEGRSQVLHPKVTLKFDAPIGRIYGYFITQGDAVVMYHKFKESEPYFVRTKLDELRIIPKISFRKRSDEQEIV